MKSEGNGARTPFESAKMVRQHASQNIGTSGNLVVKQSEMNSSLARATLTVREAAVLLGISSDAAYDAARRGQLPAIRFGRRVLISRKVLDRILAGESVLNS